MPDRLTDEWDVSAELNADERIEIESLRERVAEQRKHIKVLTEKHGPGNRRARKKIERLQQIIGARELDLEQKRGTIRYFTEHAEGLEGECDE